LPEPLLSFNGLSEALATELRAVDGAVVRDRAEKDAGRVLANSIEAPRVELTYHSSDE
jgi:hypothetical protein